MAAAWLCLAFLSKSQMNVSVITSPLGGVLGIAISVSVCLSVHSDISKATCPNFTKFSFCTCYLWSWLGSALTTVQYVMHFRLCGWRHGTCPIGLGLQAYSRGMSVSGSQMQRGGASALQLRPCLTLSAVSITIHNGVWLLRRTMRCARERSLVVSLISLLVVW